MKIKYVFLMGMLALFAALSACGFVSQQLADKAREDQLLKPGAMDRNLTNVYDTYQFKFLDKYRITHEWPRNSKGCQYAGLPTLNVNDGFHGEFYAIRDIYETNGSTKQRGAHPSWEFNRFVREKYTRLIPEFDAAGKKTGRMLEKEETGLEPVCFEAWVGTSHTLILRLHKRDLATWKALWSDYNPSGKWAQKQVNGIYWWVLENEEKDLQSTGTGGWFQSWLTPIGDTDYTLAIQLGANKQSLQFPQAHANFQSMFRHLIESVKIEEIEPLNADHPDNSPSRKPAP